MLEIASAWFKTVVQLSEDAETTPNLIKLAGRAPVVTGSVDISSLENVCERIAGSGLAHNCYFI